MKSSKIHIVLLEPEIPQNTGNIGRTCVGLSAHLHLVGKLGFSLDSTQLKRAGLDYWPKLQFSRHETWEEFSKQVEPGADLNFFSTHGTRSLWQKKFKLPSYLIFGSESRGFPPSFYTRYQEQLIKIPINNEIRSLNLSVAAGVAVFELSRQLNAGI